MNLDNWLGDWPRFRAFLDSGGWFLVGLILTAFVIVLVAALLRFIRRLFFPRRHVSLEESDRAFMEDLESCPLSAAPPLERHLTVYHMPVRMRLAVVAPVGRDKEYQPAEIEALLDKVVPGLGGIAEWDKPRLRVWPGQLSTQGFATAFHRRMHKAEAEDQQSRWILVAGKTMIGRMPIMVGLGLWAERPNNVGRLTLEPHQWLDVLRLNRT